MKFSVIVCFLILFSCKSKDAYPQSLLLFKKASNVYMNNPQNKDSLLYALSLIDSAIKYDNNNSRFYFTESRIYLDLKDYRKVVDRCNSILTLDKNNLMALLTKGVAYDLLQNQDSSHETYKDALNMLETSSFTTKILKDYQRIVLLGLIGDSSLFNQKLKEFQNDHHNDRDLKYILEN